MRIRIATAVALTAVALGAAAGCGKSGTPTPTNPGASGSATAASDACTSSGTTFTPATNVSLTGSPTYDRIKAAGKVVIGVKFDQPNLGYKDTSGKRCGFDIEIAQMLAAKLGIDPAKIEYKEIASANRETAIKGGENALALLTERYQPHPMVIRGYGAGAEVTAAGVLADVLRLVPPGARPARRF